MQIQFLEKCYNKEGIEFLSLSLSGLRKKKQRKNPRYKTKCKIFAKKHHYTKLKTILLPSFADASTWFSLSITWNDIFPSHNTAESNANACSCSSLQTLTMSKASCRNEETIASKPMTQKLNGKGMPALLMATWKSSPLNYHKHMEFLSIINAINHQAVTLDKIVVLISHFKIQSLCKDMITRIINIFHRFKWISCRIVNNIMYLCLVKRKWWGVLAF